MLKNQVITGYLFADVFKQFRKFFMAESVHDSRFLNEIGNGLMPRKFSPTTPDNLIYDEEEDAPELYLVTDGIIEIGFRHLSGNIGTGDEPFIIAKKLPAGAKYSTIICDHYVISDSKT